MNNTFKLVLSWGLALIGIGGVFVGAAYAMGEKYTDSTVSSASESYEKKDVKSLELAGIIGNVNIYKSEDNSFTVEAENIIAENYLCEIHGDKLFIEYMPKVYRMGFFAIPDLVFNKHISAATINIYVPKDNDYKFNNFHMSGVEGNVNAEFLNADSLKWTGGMGHFNISEAKIGELKISGGYANENYIDGIIKKGIEISGGYANLKVIGEVSGDIKISGGSSDLDLGGAISKLDSVKISGGNGNLNIDGNINKSINISGGDTNLNLIGELNGDLKISGGNGSINLNLSNNSDEYSSKITGGNLYYYEHRRNGYGEIINTQRIDIRKDDFEYKSKNAKYNIIVSGGSYEFCMTTADGEIIGGNVYLTGLSEDIPQTYVYNGNGYYENVEEYTTVVIAP